MVAYLSKRISTGGSGSRGNAFVRVSIIVYTGNAEDHAGYYITGVITTILMILMVVKNKQIVEWLTPVATWMKM